MENDWRIGEITSLVTRQGDIRTLAVGFTNYSPDIIHAVKISIGATDSFNDPIIFEGGRWIVAKKADLNVHQNERTTVMIPLGNYDVKNVDVKIEQIAYSTGEVIDLSHDSYDFTAADENIDVTTVGKEKEDQTDALDYSCEPETSCYNSAYSEAYGGRAQSRSHLFRTQRKEASGTLKFWVVVLLIVFYPLGLILMWEKRVFSTPVRVSLTTLFAIFFIGRLAAVNQNKRQYSSSAASDVVATSEEVTSSDEEDATVAVSSTETGNVTDNVENVEVNESEESDSGDTLKSEDGTDYAVLHDGRNDDGSGRIDVYANVSRDDPEMKTHVESVLAVFCDECLENKKDYSSWQVIIYVYNTKDNYKDGDVVQGQYCVAYWTTDEEDEITWMPEGTGVGVKAEPEAWTH